VRYTNYIPMHVSDCYMDYNLLGMIVLGRDGTCTNNSTLTDDMYLVGLEQFQKVAEVLIAFYKDTARFTPLEKIDRVKKFVTGDGEIELIFKFLSPRSMLEIRAASSFL
jgi:hypothetical protein